MSKMSKLFEDIPDAIFKSEGSLRIAKNVFEAHNLTKNEVLLYLRRKQPQYIFTSKNSEIDDRSFIEFSWRKRIH